MKKESEKEKTLTKHPLGKSGVNIDKAVYETFKDGILDKLSNRF